MIKKYTTFEMLEILNGNRSKIFKRYKDDDFRVYANMQGALFMDVDSYKNMPFNILNYLNELWVIEDVN